MNNLLFCEELDKIANEINIMLAQLLPTTYPKNSEILFEAIKYSTLSSSKKIRGFILIKTAEIFGVTIDQSIKIAAAIEMIHTYSLIHDDLPSIDNDDYRRGKLSCHKKFGEAIAILAGDALLTYAFEVIASEESNINATLRIKLIQELTRAIGSHGMIGGQVIDIMDNNISYQEAKAVHSLKTGALIAASCVSGAILGKASDEEIVLLRSYSEKLGLIFQMVDDIIDEKDDQKAINKNLLNFTTSTEIKEEIEQLKYMAINDLKNLKKLDINILAELINYVINQLTTKKI